MRRTGIVILALFVLSGWSAALTAAPQAAQKPPATQPEASAAPPQVKLVGQMPAGAAPRPFHFPKAAVKTLPNGLRVFVVTSAELPAVSVRLVLTAAGSVHDPAGKPGVAAMAADLLTQGTEKRTAQQIAEAIDFVGGSLSARADDDGTYVSATVVKKDFDLAMDLLADVVLHPAFRAEELDRRRQQLLSGLRVQYADPSYLASAIFSRAVFGDHPYGFPNEGTPESARALSRDDMVRFRDVYYAPNQALLAFAGDITAEAAFAAAEKFFGAWPRKEVPETALPAPPAVHGLRVYLIDKPDAVQTQIRVGRPGIRRNDPDYIPLYVTNRIFGGGFNSRLNTEVRVKKGLTYGASSAFVSEKLAGDFVASTFTRTEATVEATQLVINLIGGMATGGVTPKEMDFARDYLAGVFPIQTETSDQVAGRVLSVAQFDLPADYNETYQQKILGVSSEQVKAVAARYFTPADLDLVLVGNVAQFRDALKRAFPNAKYEEIPFDQVDLLASNLRKPAPVATPATPESVARGKEILAAAAAAAGGSSLLTVESAELTTKGQYFSPQGSLAAEATVQVAYPDKLRAVTKFAMGTLTQGYDGTVGWVQSPQGISKLPPNFNEEFQRSVDLIGGWGIYRQAQAGKAQMQAVGEETVEGKQALVVSWQEGSSPVKLYFDPQTHLLIAARYRQNSPQGPVEAFQVWSDFRPVSGAAAAGLAALVFPFHSVTYHDGSKFAESDVQEVKVNVKPDPGVFAAPRTEP